MQYAQRQSGRSTWGEKVRFARGQAAAAMVRTHISESTNEALRRAAERKAPAQEPPADRADRGIENVLNLWLGEHTAAQREMKCAQVKDTGLSSYLARMFLVFLMLIEPQGYTRVRV